MSMTLFFWEAPVVRDEDEARALLEPWYDREEDGAFEPSDAVRRFANDLRALYPEPSPTDEHPSSMSIQVTATDRLAAIDVSWSAEDRVLSTIIDLAAAYRLSWYDPQSHALELPFHLRNPEQLRTEKTATGWLRLLGLMLAFAALTAAAWMIPWPLLRWPLVALGAFATLAALFVMAAMLFGPRPADLESV